MDDKIKLPHAGIVLQNHDHQTFLPEIQKNTPLCVEVLVKDSKI